MKEHALATERASLAPHGPSSHEVEVRIAGLCPVWTARAAQLPAFVPLEGESLTIGRGATNALSLAHDHSASRTHAKLFRRDHRIWLADLGSTNGTWVSGQRIREQPLNDRDVIRIGGTLLRFSDFDPTERTVDAVTDLGALVEQFLRELGRTELEPSIEFMEAIATHEPSSVRELASAVKVAAGLATSKTLSAAHLPFIASKSRADAKRAIDAEDTRQIMRRRRA